MKNDVAYDRNKLPKNNRSLKLLTPHVLNQSIEYLYASHLATKQAY